MKYYSFFPISILIISSFFLSIQNTNALLCAGPPQPEYYQKHFESKFNRTEKIFIGTINDFELAKPYEPYVKKNDNDPITGFSSPAEYLLTVTVNKAFKGINKNDVIRFNVPYEPTLSKTSLFYLNGDSLGNSPCFYAAETVLQTDSEAGKRDIRLLRAKVNPFYYYVAPGNLVAKIIISFITLSIIITTSLVVFNRKKNKPLY